MRWAGCDLKFRAALLGFNRPQRGAVDQPSRGIHHDSNPHVSRQRPSTECEQLSSLSHRRRRLNETPPSAGFLLAAVFVSSCAGQPVADPQATVVLADIQPALECPEPMPVQPPADLIAPLELASPEILPGGQGDYGITREGLEMLVDAFRAAGERLSRWRAWAQ